MRTSKIAIISLGRKGAGPVIGLELARALNRGHKVLFVHSNQSELNITFDAPDAHCISMNTFSDAITLIFSLIFPINIIRIIRQLWLFKADIVIWPMIHPWTPFINIFMGNSNIVTFIHDPNAHMGTNSIVWSLYTKSAIYSSNINVFLSFQSLDSNENTLLKAKSMYITLPVFEYYGKHIADREKESVNLLFFGRIQKYKDMDLLLDIFESVQKQRENVRLIIAGEGDVAEWIGRIKGNGNIELINKWIKNEDIETLFNRAYIVLLPYKEATQSGIIPLAYEFNVPVIASAESGIKSQIIDYKTGILIERNSAEEFASACINIINDRKLYKLMTENISKYRNAHTWENAIQSIIKAAEDG